MTRERTIDRLRRVHGGEWRYERERVAQWHQVSTGRRVYRCAALAPRYDGDDDSFDVQLRWEDTSERAEFSEWRTKLKTRPNLSE